MKQYTLDSIGDIQVIVLASFEGSDDAFYTATKDVKAHTTNISPRLIRKIEEPTY